MKDFEQDIEDLKKSLQRQGKNITDLTADSKTHGFDIKWLLEKMNGILEK